MKLIGPDDPIHLKFRDENQEVMTTTTARPYRFRTSTIRTTPKVTSTTPKPQIHASRRQDKEPSTMFKSLMSTDRIPDKQFLSNDNSHDIHESESLPSPQNDDKVLLVLRQSEVDKIILLAVTSICLTVVIMILRYA